MHFETRNQPQEKGKPGRVRRNDRRAAIARKCAWLTDGLTTRH
jgi:hypothetical protein